jgi:hypothetical protein
MWRMQLLDRGGKTNSDFKPHWKPPENRIGSRCQEFMFMGRIRGINLYKHVQTPRYLNLDDCGFVYSSGKYKPTKFGAQMVLIESEILMSGSTRGCG